MEMKMMKTGHHISKTKWTVNVEEVVDLLETSQVKMVTNVSRWKKLFWTRVITEAIKWRRMLYQQVKEGRLLCFNEKLQPAGGKQKDQCLRIIGSTLGRHRQINDDHNWRMCLLILDSKPGDRTHLPYCTTATEVNYKISRSSLSIFWQLDSSADCLLMYYLYIFLSLIN